MAPAGPAAQPRAGRRANRQGSAAFGRDDRTTPPENRRLPPTGPQQGPRQADHQRTDPAAPTSATARMPRTRARGSRPRPCAAASARLPRMRRTPPMPSSGPPRRVRPAHGRGAVWRRPEGGAAVGVPRIVRRPRGSRPGAWSIPRPKRTPFRPSSNPTTGGRPSPRSPPAHRPHCRPHTLGASARVPQAIPGGSPFPPDRRPQERPPSWRSASSTCSRSA